MRIANIDVTHAFRRDPSEPHQSHDPRHPQAADPTREGRKRSDLRANAEPHAWAGGAFYCNRAISTWLDIQALNKQNVLLRMDEFDGKPVTSFQGHSDPDLRPAFEH